MMIIEPKPKTKKIYMKFYYELVKDILPKMEVWFKQLIFIYKKTMTTPMDALIDMGLTPMPLEDYLRLTEK